MKVGADRKKTVMLGVLLLVLAYFLYSNVIAPAPDVPSRPSPAKTQKATPKSDPTDLVFQAPPAAAQPRPTVRPGQPVRFSARDKRTIDLASVDPTIRNDLLDKVQAVNLAGGERNLFQFGAPPAPKMPDPKVMPKPIEPPKPVEPPKPIEPVKPPPPPIPLKFYGYASQRPGEKRAFFLDGEEIFVATEGALIKNRYKVIRIGVNSVVVEDTQFKNEQTLPLEEQQQG